MAMVTPTQLSQDTRRPRPVGVASSSRGHKISMRRVRVVVRSIRAVRGRDGTGRHIERRRDAVAFSNSMRTELLFQSSITGRGYPCVRERNVK
jgi:hypothetical protein